MQTSFAGQENNRDTQGSDRMKVVFRADASIHIGTGHIARCTTLAKELRRRGAEIQFVTRAHAGHQAAMLARAGFACTTLPAAEAATPKPDDYAAWLGVSEETDARETMAAAGEAEWLVVDHYGLGPRWEQALRGSAGSILAIDDLDRAHDVDLVLDQNLSDKPARYAGVEKKLLGPNFALLGDEYRSGAPAFRPDVNRILVFFGGADPKGAAGAAVEALDDPAFAHMHVDMAVGAASPARERLEEWAARRARTAVHVGLPSLRDLMAGADLAVGGGGIAMLERCCMGLPAIVMTIAANQVPGTRALAAEGAVTYLGDFEAGAIADLAGAVRTLAADAVRRRAMADRGRLLVDGWGARRVAERIMPTPTSALALRPADAGDCGFYYTLANDPDVRRNSFQSTAISWEEHRRWFEAKLAAPGSRLWVLTANELPVGQLRLDRKDAHTYISYSLDPLVRGRGWGREIIALGLRKLFGTDSPVIRAEVKSGNLVSRAIFEKMGFRTVGPDQDGKMTYGIDRETFATADRRATVGENSKE